MPLFYQPGKEALSYDVALRFTKYDFTSTLYVRLDSDLHGADLLEALLGGGESEEEEDEEPDTIDIFDHLIANATDPRNRGVLQIREEGGEIAGCTVVLHHESGNVITIEDDDILQFLVGVQIINAVEIEEEEE